MPTSPRSSRASARFRTTDPASAAAGSAAITLHWRPSRLLAFTLVLLGLAGAAGLLASDLQPPLSWFTAPVAVVEGLRLARGHLRRKPRSLVRAGDGLTLDGQMLRAPVLHDRGPVVVLHARLDDGAAARLAWFPDTLPPGLRRELRLAVAAAAPRTADGAMAP